MLVFADAVASVSVAQQCARIREVLDRAACTAPGLARHEAVVEALIDSGELVQGVADAGLDSAMSMHLARRLGDCMAVSWRSAFAHLPALPWTELDSCGRDGPAQRVEVRTPEGFAFYALYPECYLVAARRLARRWHRERAWQVFGLRSIGTSLSAVVAAGLGAGQPATLRPVGPPFDRRIDADPTWIDRSCTAFAVVDEGPGQSGSSMAAASRWLTANGIPPEQIHLLPGHTGGPGPRASAATRAVWRMADTQVAGFDEVILHARRSAHCLSHWVADAVGPLHAPLLDLTGGAWRTLHRCAGNTGPPVHPWQERRKFLACTADGSWLVRFVGIGRAGREHLARSTALAKAGFSPMPTALRHGFVIERWRGDMAPAAGGFHGPARGLCLRRVADYLAFRSVRFAVQSGRGASLTTLLGMASSNAREAFGSRFEGLWALWRRHLKSLEALVRPCETDNRMHPWEWLVRDGEILKTDAIDHHASHDLVGCQDIAWDLAGAIVELELTPAEAQLLQRRVGLRGLGGDHALVQFMLPCYLAFQMGYYVEAADSSAGQERERLQKRGRFYRVRLEANLCRSGPLGLVQRLGAGG